jgi:imidazolonepropionase
MKKTSCAVLITNISELITCNGKPVNNGIDPAEGRLGIRRNAAIAIERGVVSAVGTELSLRKRFSPRKIVDAGGCVVTPGLVDPHTHAVYAGDRSDEFMMRALGLSYLAIAKRGGGINATVRATRKASRKTLTQLLAERLQRMAEHGTTTVEVKSGYGLDIRTELKLLEAIRDAGKQVKIDVIPTFLGAHEVPPEHRKNKKKYIRILNEEMTPAAANQGIAEFADAFCEKGVFTVNETRKILERAGSLGFKLKVHADEFAKLGGAGLAAELGAVSADHLLVASAGDLKKLSIAGTIPVLLPGTSFFLGLPGRPDIDAMRKYNLPIALGTDCNPGTSNSESMPMMMTIACSKYRMTPAEALLGSTRHAAWALDRRDRGWLGKGARADFVCWDVQSWHHLAYHYGVNLVKETWVKGKRAVKR